MSYCERPDFSAEQGYTAIKEHECCECRKSIRVGEHYVKCVIGMDGEVEAFKQHARCYHFARYLNYTLAMANEDGCVPFGCITEELGEYDDPELSLLWQTVQNGFEFQPDQNLWLNQYDATVVKEKKVRPVKPPDTRPVVAYLCAIEGFTEFYVAATRPGKARHIAVSDMKDAGYTESAQYKNVRVSRAKQFDEWARTAKRGCFSRDAVMDHIGSGSRVM